MTPQYTGSGEGLPDFAENAAGAPAAEQCADSITRLVAPGLGVEVDIHHGPDHREPLAKASRLADRAPLAAGQRDDHDSAAVGGREIAPKAAVEVVADRWPRAAVDLYVPDIAEVADRREHHIRQRGDDLLTLPAARAMAFRGE